MIESSHERYSRYGDAMTDSPRFCRYCDGWGDHHADKHPLRVNKAVLKSYPNTCPLIEITGDGVECGTCWHHAPDGICPRHGYWRDKALDMENSK